MSLKSMVHWNGNQVCCIDVETTGLDPYFHEIIQICILPLDSNFNPRKDVLPFYIEIQPEWPERISREAMKINKLDLAKIMERGHDKEKAKDLLQEWIEKLNLPYTKYGTRKKILSLGHCIASFDIPFIRQWLGVDLYNELFDHHIRDIASVVMYLNDKAAMHAEDIKFKKMRLAYIATAIGITHDRAHDALQDCLVEAQVWKKLVQQGLLG